MLIGGRACNTRFVKYILGMDLLDRGAILGFIFRGVFVRYIWYLLYESNGIDFQVVLYWVDYPLCQVNVLLLRWDKHLGSITHLANH